MNIVELFLSAAKKYPDNIAIIDKKASIEYTRLAKEVIETAAYFRQKGIREGDRVLVFVPMSIELYRIVLALFYIGATAVFLDEWASKKRLELCCRLANCKGFIGAWKARLFTLFSGELRRIPIKLSVKKRLSGKTRMAQLDSDTTALITFTTGSTGIPKAADRTHAFLKAQFEALLDEIDPKVEDVDMPVLPIVLFVNLGVGCTSVIADFNMRKPEKMDVESLVKQIEENMVSRITASPYFIERLSDYAIEKGRIYAIIEKIFTGGAPVFPRAAMKMKQAFANAVCNIVYGSTEAEPISSIRARDLIARSNQLNSGLPVGKPFHQALVRIIKIEDREFDTCSEAEFKDMTLDEGQTGEIIVAGDHVLKRYFRNEQAFRRNKIAVGEAIWHRTGDSGWMREGQLHLTGHCKQLIRTETGYLSPFIIENRLQEIEGISMGTLIQMAGQLVLFLETTLSIKELKQGVKDIPHDHLKVVPKIPRDLRHHSKIDYERLREDLN